MHRPSRLCQRRTRRLRREISEALDRVGQLDASLRRTGELLTVSRQRARRDRKRLTQELARLRWFRQAACRAVTVRLAQAEFDARLREIDHERLQKRYASARGERLRKRLRPSLDAAAAERARFHARLERLRELKRRCGLADATRALRPIPPPPPAPRPPRR